VGVEEGRRRWLNTSGRRMITEPILAKDAIHGYQKNSGIMQIGAYIAGLICEAVMPNDRNAG
jgi:hypothetical protein